MPPAEISITIPPDSRFIALARVTAASLAAELDFTIDEVEDLTVGANELVALLVDHAVEVGAVHVELVFRVGDDRIEIECTTQGDHSPAEASPDPLAERILAAVVDEFDLGPGSGRIVKVRAAP